MAKSKAVDELRDLLSDNKVRRALIETAGENAIAVIEALNKASQDEDIAKLLSLRVSDVRSVLNRLNEEGFTYYERTKDEETGWYSYFWTLDINKFKEWIKKKLLSKYERLRLMANEGEYYFCPHCGVDVVYSFEEAMDINFKCPKCNETLDLLEEEKVLKMMPKLDFSKLKRRAKKTKKRRKSK